MKCGKCGTQNRKEVAFCTTCGAALKRASHRVKQTSASRGLSGKTIAIVTGAVVVVLVIIAVRGSALRGTNLTGAQSAVNSFSLDVQQVAKKFYCACGTCDEPELARCTCPTAIEEKELIDRELKRGTSAPEVVKLVHRRYGRIKSQHASLVTSGRSEVIPAARTLSLEESGGKVGIEGAPPLLPDVAGQADRIAAEADTLAIASRFICACGQCGELVLSKCACDHPRGAAEMKAFIAYKISQKRHTIDEIVTAVAYEYGHLSEE